MAVTIDYRTDPMAIASGDCPADALMAVGGEAYYADIAELVDLSTNGGADGLIWNGIQVTDIATGRQHKILGAAGGWSSDYVDNHRIFASDGIPANDLGYIGDVAIDYSTGKIYEKTGVSTWSSRYNVASTGVFDVYAASAVNIADLDSCQGTLIDTGVTLNSGTDGISVLLHDNQGDASEAGIYTYADAGNGTLRRHTDYDTIEALQKGRFYILEGNSYRNKTYVCETQGTVVLDTGLLSFKQDDLVAGGRLSFVDSGATFQVDGKLKCMNGLLMTDASEHGISMSTGALINLASDDMRVHTDTDFGVDIGTSFDVDAGTTIGLTANDDITIYTSASSIILNSDALDINTTSGADLGIGTTLDVTVGTALDIGVGTTLDVVAAGVANFSASIFNFLIGGVEIGTPTGTAGVGNLVVQNNITAEVRLTADNIVVGAPVLAAGFGSGDILIEDTLFCDKIVAEGITRGGVKLIDAYQATVDFDFNVDGNSMVYTEPSGETGNTVFSLKDIPIGLESAPFSFTFINNRPGTWQITFNDVAFDTINDGDGPGAGYIMILASGDAASYTGIITAGGSPGKIHGYLGPSSKNLFL